MDLEEVVGSQKVTRRVSVTGGTVTTVDVGDTPPSRCIGPSPAFR